MSAAFDVEAAADGTLLSISGEIDLANAGELYAAIVGNAGARRLIIDLASLDYIDSAGLAALHRAYRELSKDSREMTIVLPPDAPCARTFEIVALDLPMRPDRG